jgi:transposase-like protein
MSPKKITDLDKQEIVNLYFQAGETTASLASRYGVSASTISRLLKSTIPEDEYEVLIQQKRGYKGGSDEEVLEIDRVDTPPAETSSEPVEEEIHYGQTQQNNKPLARRRRRSAADTDISTTVDRPTVDDSITEPPRADPKQELKKDDTALQAQMRRVRRRSSALSNLDGDDTDPQDELPIATTEPQSTDSNARTEWQNAPTATDDYFITPSVVFPSVSNFIASSPSPNGVLEEDEDEEDEDVSELAAMFGEEVGDLGDDEEDEDDDEDWDEPSVDSKSPVDKDRLLNRARLQIQVMPLSEAVLPRTCYIVIDRFAELIARPLKDFADLGQIPGEEIQQRTLPIFDNPRVAKRFSNNRTQRVIKVPDSRIFHKTIHHLRSKGITRLLVDGQIYSLN